MRRVFVLALLLVASMAMGQRHPLLSGGPMLAYSEMTETAVWVQTTAPADVQIAFTPISAIRYSSESPYRWEPVSDGVRTVSKVVRATEESDHIALVRLTGLPMGHRFQYELLLNGQTVARDYPLEFQTQPHWRWAKNPAEPPTFRFAIGSCSYIDQPETDRPGRPYGGEHEIYQSIHGKRPDFMVWMGDNVYYREMDWLTEAAMRQRWRYDRAFPQLQALLGSTHHYATWDDHDFGPNDSDRSFRLRSEALRVFTDYFPAVRYGTPEAKGVFQRFEWADVEFFLLDDRYHRTPNRYPDGPHKVMLGREQVQWLKDALVSSNATFKVVVGGGQMLNPMVFFEAFGQFPHEQKELFDFIATNDIRGLVFLSGDRHATELLRVRWPGASYDWLEYTSSPLTAGPGRNPREENNPARVPGTWVNQRNFGLVEVSGPRGDRQLKLTAHDKDGGELWSHQISERSLRGPG
jgi:alkaline phosphatase D